METLKSCPFEEPVGEYEIENDKPMMTNDEWRRICSTEDFAEFINLIIRVGPYENEPKDFWEHVYGRGGEHGAKSIVAWLKKPHTPKE